MSQDQDPTIDLNMHLPREPRSSPGLSLVPTPGLRLGYLVNERFKIAEVLGKGAMGTVYRIIQVYSKKQYALKVLNGVTYSANTMRRFQNEAEAASRLDHPNLAKAIEFGLLNRQQPFIVMDLVQGETLAHHLKTKGKLEWQQALRIFIQVFDAMAHAHEQGVIHRDIKPSNIVLIQSDDQHLVPKVVDFGIAKVELDSGVDGTPLTKTGEVFGTPLYMSPEQCSGTKVDNRSDIYSLGCVLFETLTGCPPFTGDTALETMMQHKTTDAPELQEASLGLNFPPTLDSVIKKMMAKDRDDRYPNCRAAASDLTAVLQNKLPEAARKARHKPSPKVDQAYGSTTPKAKPLLYAAILMSIIALASAVLLTIKLLSNNQSVPQKLQSNRASEAIVPPQPEPPNLSSSKNLPTQASAEASAMPSSNSQDSDAFQGALIEKALNANRDMVARSIEIATDRWSFDPKQGKLEASELKPLRSHTGITTINLSEHPELKGDDTIQYLPPENLQTLYIRNTNLTNKGIREIAEKLSQLEFLDITGNHEVTDLRPIEKLRMLSQLRVMDLSELMPMWTGPHKPVFGGLTMFDASYGAMNDATLPYIESLHKLTHLSIACNQQLTVKSAATLARCHGLQDLNISEMAVTDAWLAKIQHLELVRLNLSSTKVTKGGVTKLLKNMPTLKYLVLEPTLSNADRADLRRQFPNCEIR